MKNPDGDFETRQKLDALRTLERQNEELRRLVAVIEAARDRYFGLYDLAPVGCCSLCQQGLIVEANRMAATLLGLERAALVRQPFRRFIHPEDQAVFAVGDQRLMTAGEWLVRELRMLKPDGEMFWARLEASAAEDENGALICHVVISDITGRKQIDDVLDRQSRFQQLLVEMSSTYINLPLEAVGSAIQGSLRDMAMFVDADRAYIFDYDFQRQICINTYEWCDEGIEPQLDCLQAMPLAMMPDWVEKHCRGEAMYVPDVFALPRGGVREVLEPQGIKSLLATPMMSNGRCAGFVGFDSVRRHHVYSEKEQSLLMVFALMLTSIQMRQQAEDRLRESEAKHRLLIENTHDIIYTLNRDGVFTFVSPAWTRLVGHPVTEVVGKSFHPLVHPDDLVQCIGFLRTVIETGQQQEGIEYRMRHANGSWRWHTTGVVPLKEKDGAVTGFVGIAHDITPRKQMEEALRIERDSNRNLLDTVEAIIVALDREGRIRLINRKGCQLLGYHEAELIGKDWFETCLPPTVDLRRIHEIFEKALACDLAGSEYYENPVITRTGEERLIAWHNSTIRDPQGEVIGGLSAGEDITERKQAEKQLQLAASVFTHAREGIAITDADGAIIDVNAAFTRITGYPRDEVLDCNSSLIKFGWQDSAFYEAMWRDLIERGHWDGEIWNRRKNGEVYAEMLTISAVRDDHDQTYQYVALLSDITALKEHEQRLEHIAHYDALTTLPNRVLLADRLQQAMAQAQRRGQQLAVAYVDLDGFKAINDRYGHEVGDQLLMTVSARMKQTLRESDTLARLGGDEFVAVLGDLTDVAASAPLISRLLAAAAEPVLLEDCALQVSASVGVAFYPQKDEVDADQLLRQADQAMYQAKLAGKDRYCVFDSEQDRSVRSHHESRERIRRALITGEFVLHYQPKVNMRTGAVIGAEALIRWQHPERGLLPPAVFLPVIEEHPLAVAVGEWVIDAVLTQIEIWRRAGLDLPVSVNVGARQLQRADFVERLRTLLAAHPEVRPSWLELEVLETSALQDLARVSQIIAACGQMGVKFALDDFGTGYSSLTYLKRLPVALLKIDQSFVRDMLDDPDDLAILEGVLGLAIVFRRQVIAEGVETVEQGEMLLKLGCELAQGYGIARPMPAHQMPDWSRTWRPDWRWLARTPTHREDLPILFARVEHRAWIAAIEACLKGESHMLPPLDHHQCRFGAWLDARSLNSSETDSALQAIQALHQRVHELGLQLLELQAQRRNAEALAGLSELHALREQLQAQLAGLLDNDMNSQNFR